MGEQTNIETLIETYNIADYQIAQREILCRYYMSVYIAECKLNVYGRMGKKFLADTFVWT